MRLAAIIATAAIILAAAVTGAAAAAAAAAVFVFTGETGFGDPLATPAFGWVVGVTVGLSVALLGADFAIGAAARIREELDKLARDAWRHAARGLVLAAITAAAIVPESAAAAQSGADYPMSISIIMLIIIVGAPVLMLAMVAIDCGLINRIRRLFTARGLVLAAITGAATIPESAAAASGGESAGYMIVALIFFAPIVATICGAIIRAISRDDRDFGARIRGVTTGADDRAGQCVDVALESLTGISRKIFATWIVASQVKRGVQISYRAGGTHSVESFVLLKVIGAKIFRADNMAPIRRLQEYVGAKYARRHSGERKSRITMAALYKSQKLAPGKWFMLVTGHAVALQVTKDREWMIVDTGAAEPTRWSLADHPYWLGSRKQVNIVARIDDEKSPGEIQARVKVSTVNMPPYIDREETRWRADWNILAVQDWANSQRW